MFFLLACMVIIEIYGLIMQYDGENDVWVAWIAIVCYVIGIEHYYASAFASLFITTPVEYISIVTSICAIVWSLLSMFEGYLFGLLVINDDSNDVQTKTYDWSIFMLGITAFIGLCAAIWVHIMDVWKDGPLHKGVRKIPKFHDNEEYQPLLSDGDELII